MNTLRQDLQHYLSMRRGLGFQLRDGGKGLVDFCRLCGGAQGPLHHSRTCARVGATTTEGPTGGMGPTPRFRARIRPVSQCHRPAHRDSSPGAVPFRAKRARSYIYSDAEIRSLLHAALDMPYRFEHGKLRPWMFHCLFGLLSVAGLRIGEARNLELQDVDLKAAVLTIRGAKFGKTRLVPLHASTCRALADYIARGRRHWAGRTVSSYLFVSSWGNRVDGGEIHRTFYALFRKIGLRGVADSHGPCLHDMRHRFATNTLVRWYRSGQDPEQRLPLLSTYLGHVHIADTQWYLESSPELMREAMMRRVEQSWEDRP